MSETYIPPFPTGNTSVNTPYTQVFENVRATRQSGGSSQVPASPLHPQASKSPLHHQGSSGSGSGGSKSGSSHKPVNPKYPSHPSPKPSKNSGSGMSHEGHIGNSTPSRNTPSSTPGRSTPRRNKKKPPTEQVQHDILPPFPSDDAGTGSNYTEMFRKYRDDNTSSTAPPVEYTPTNDRSPKMKLSDGVLSAPPFDDYWHGK